MSQAGMLLELAAAPGVGGPPDPDGPDDGAADVLDRAEAAPKPEPGLVATPTCGLPDPAAAFDGRVVPGNVTPP